MSFSALRIQKLDLVVAPCKYRLQPDTVACKNIHNAQTYRLTLSAAVAFDMSNGRLGHGKGYYDKFLAEATHVLTHRPSVGTCALSHFHNSGY